MVTKALTATSKLFTLLAIACSVVSLLNSNVAKGDIFDDQQVALAKNCIPTDTGVGGAPCYDKAGGQCYYNQKASTCTASPNNSNCTCAAI